MKKLLVAACAATAMFAPMTASAGDVSGSASLDYVTDYVFRGVSFAGAALQPGIELAVGDAYVGVWGSTPLGTASALGGDEIDFYAGYGFGLSDSLSADVGITYYYFPQTGGFLSDDAGSYEVYGGLSLDSVLSPSVYAYYDLTLEALTLEGSIGHSVGLSDSVSLDLGLTGGLVDVSGGSYEWATGSASIGFPIGGAVSGYVGVNYSLNSEDNLGFVGGSDLITDADGFFDIDPNFSQSGDLFWAGAGIAANF